MGWNGSGYGAAVGTCSDILTAGGFRLPMTGQKKPAERGFVPDTVVSSVSAVFFQITGDAPVTHLEGHIQRFS